MKLITTQAGQKVHPAPDPDGQHAGAPEFWTLPVTSESGPPSLWIWQQQEYVTCMKCGFGFAVGRAERSSIAVLWHYALRVPAGIIYPTVEMYYDGAHGVTFDQPSNPFYRGPR